MPRYRSRDGIEQLPSGKWRPEVSVGGVRQRQTFPKNAFKMAVAWRKRMRVKQASVSLGLERPPNTDSAISYNGVADRFLEFCRTGQAQVYTARYMESIEEHVAALVKWWGRRQVRRTTPELINEYVRKMRRAGRSSSTIRNRLNQLSRLHKYTAMLGLIDGVPCRVDRPRLVQRSVRQATPEADLGRLVEAAGELDDPRPLAVILLAADAGLRRAEIGRLRGEDIRAGSIHVAVRSETDRTKSARGRDVPIITGRLRTALERLSPTPGQPLIRFVGGVEVHAQDVINPVWREALGGTAQLHELRHRFGTRLAHGNEDLSNIQRWMGHRSLATTQRYLHPTGEPSNRARAALEPPTDSPRDYE